jgi:subtilisin family serine protease
MKKSNIIRITVVDFNNQPISNAEVTISAKREKVNLKYDKYLSAYCLEEFVPERYNIIVAASGFEKQQKEVFIGASGIEELFILGKKGMPFYYRGTVKVPFKQQDEKFGLTLHAPEDKNQIELLKRISEEFKLTEVKTHDNYKKNGLFIFSFPSKFKEEEKQKLLETFKKRLNTPVVGPILKEDEKNATILTDEIIVRFKGSVEEKQVQAISKELGLTILRTIPYAGNAYQYRVNKGSMYKALEACNKLVEMKVVEYAEPNLYHTYEEDAIVPNNYLFPEQWDHPIINTPDAWQVLNDNLGVAQRFGSPDIVVAVVDSGVNSNHPQFNGTVSNGQPKIFTSYDFANMVANNNSLDGSHGTCCASAAVGLTNASSVAGGVPDGTVGIAGNCRVMGIRQPGWAAGLETNYADMYIWIGGFNPNSAIAGFPAPLTRGADIITNSFGYSVNNPISGLMRDTFDHLTTYGRNGKGVLLFFSAGNDNVNLDLTFRRPWGMYQKCMSVAAATLANDGATETRADYSNFGTPISFCTHSNDGDVNRHNPPTGYAAWVATILNGAVGSDGNAPRNRERQTTLTAAANTGATTVTVASTAGMVNGQAIIIGNPSANISPSEAKTITNIAGNVITFTPALFNNKANGANVNYGNRDYRNRFGGTSYATPVIAGVSALMLSVNNRLTWLEVREILRETAIKIDPNNTNVTGRWRDAANRISTDPGYTGPFFSQFYGFGRISAVAAVTTAQDYLHTRDIYIRDNMADTGAGASTTPHWRGVDIWVRNVNDGMVPANYATDANTVHLPPIAGQSNWLNVRYRNRGTTNSYPFYLRAYLAHYPGAEFIYHDNFIPTVRPNGAIPNPLVPGTYLIGEQLVNPVAAGADGFVTFEWQQDLIPPQTVVVSGMNVNWHPCLLVEVSPHDGFIPTGNHVWDNNNLAQKNISIVYPDSSSDNASLVVLGNRLRGRLKNLKIVIFPDPQIKVPYFITFVDPKINELFVSKIYRTIKGAELGKLKKATGVWIHTYDKISLEIPYEGLTAMIIAIGKQKAFKEGFEINIVQYSGKRVSGSCGIAFKTRR